MAIDAQNSTAKKISELSVLNTIVANSYVPVVIPGIANYKMSLSNLKTAINNDIQNNVNLINYISGSLSKYITTDKVNEITTSINNCIAILSGNVYQLDSEIENLLIPSISGLAYETYVDNQTQDLLRQITDLKSSIIDNEKTISNTFNEYKDLIDSNNIELQRLVNNLSEELINDEKVISLSINSLNTKMEVLDEVLEEINNTSDTDTNINTISDISKFLTGFDESLSLSGVLYKLKQEILEEINK